MMNILIVDDDEIYRSYLSNALQLVGHTVLNADNGQSGLNVMANHTVDLIITDIFMPKMDGIDLLSALSRHHPQCKVIAITGGYKNMKADLLLKMAKNFGAVDVISKPFQMKTVIQKINQIMQTSYH